MKKKIANFFVVHSGFTIVAYFSVLVLLLCLTVSMVTKTDNALYNNGICSNCGGSYEQVNFDSTTFVSHYIYICDTCENIIVTKTAPKN